jgi:hypothetical protein
MRNEVELGWGRMGNTKRWGDWDMCWRNEFSDDEKVVGCIHFLSPRLDRSKIH